jgi:hypothetical protein
MGFHVATGLRDEIDELDQLLDKLLQLPIDRATASTAPAVLPMKSEAKVLALHQYEETEESETAVLTLPVSNDNKDEESLRIVRSAAGDVEFTQSQQSENEFSPDLSPSSDSASTLPLPLTKSEPKVAELDEDIGTSRVRSLDSATESEPRMPRSSNQLTPLVESKLIVNDPVPWLDDEPLPVPTISTGPKVEIIHGPHSEVVVASSSNEPESKLPAAKRSILFWILWTWTWLFDQSLGRWFPFLRRPNVKFLLGLVGVALFAVSIYIVWQGITR